MSSLFSHTVVDVIFSANNGCEFAPVADATTRMPAVAKQSIDEYRLQALS